MLAAKSERDALKGTLFFNFAHYALRPWPWIIVGLASLLVYPELSDIARTFPNVDPKLIGHDLAYPAMLRFLPAGFLGLMVAGMLAAYVSTLSTHLNWGTSYLVHDFYRRFMAQGRSEAHYVMVGRLVTALLMLVSGLLTYALDTAQESFQLLLKVGAGTGLLYLLRWYWWRINAWSEIAAMAGSFLIAVGFFIASKSGSSMPAHQSLLITVGATTLIWIAVTLVTAPTNRETLVSFYRLVRPAGSGWNPIRAIAGPQTGSPDKLADSMLGWVFGCAAVYSALFGTGSFLYGWMPQAMMWGAVFVVSVIGLWWVMPRLWSETSEA
jgi:Na+/proline symporter